MSARPDGASICDTKPLATAGLDMRGTLILHANTSVPTHNPRVDNDNRMSVFHTNFFLSVSLPDREIGVSRLRSHGRNEAAPCVKQKQSFLNHL